MNELLADADLCVKCGLCLPHCPTYRQTQNENESPRGRIALIQAWAGGQLEASKQLREHIDHCLLCRSCERVCPAVVPYSRIIDDFRSRFYRQGNTSLALSLMKKVARDKNAQRLAQNGLKFYQGSRLQKTAKRLKLPKLLGLQTLERLLPAQARSESLASFKNYYPALAEVKGNVGLFTGCMGELLDVETVKAAIKVLTAVGFNVHLPGQQTCCGALALHDGDQRTAGQLANLNNNAFAQVDIDFIVTIASGCGSQLREYKHTAFADKVIDISQLIIKSGCALTGRLKPLPASVCLHTPCSLKNVLRAEQGAQTLLRQIPGIELTELPESVLCCGSAGGYMLEHPNMAQALLGDVLTAVIEKKPDYLVSSNIGCILHIMSGLRERGIAIDVIHPIVLVARQMDGVQQEEAV